VRVQKKLDWLSCFFETLFGSNRRFGGYIVHIGFLVVYLGIIGTAYKTEADFVLKAGETYSFKNYKFDYVSPQISQDEHKQILATEIRVYKDDKLLGSLLPAKYFYFASQQPSTEVAILHEAFLDVYLVLGALDDVSTRADFRVMLNPLISYVWIGGVIMLAGILLVLLPRTKKTKLPLALLVFCLLAGSTMPSYALTDEESHSHEEITDPFTVLQEPDANLTRLKSLGEKYFCMCGDCVRTDLRACKCSFAQKERATLFALMQKGFSDDDIEQSLVKQYGPAVYAYPPEKGFLKRSYQGVWVLGIVTFVGGFYLVGRLINKKVVVADSKAVVQADASQDVYKDKLIKELEDF